jgi:hypothetical protein
MTAQFFRRLPLGGSAGRPGKIVCQSSAFGEDAVTTQLVAALNWIAYAGREIDRGDTKQADNALERAASALRAIREADLTRPIKGIESRAPQEVFDIMCSRLVGLVVSA